MEAAFATVAGILVALSVYLLLSRWAIRMVLGIFILGNATHLLIFVSGRLTRETPPLIEATAKAAEPGIANPVPQALILTAIVISFSLFTFLLVLVHRVFEELGTVNTDLLVSTESSNRGESLVGSDV
ncbi:MAG: NADH-quinone oxidoreductase subunit K [Myxococcota bacterium]